MRRDAEFELAELNHRFANTFHMFSALIRLRRGKAETDEAREHLAWLEDAVQVLWLLQQRLASAPDDGIGSYLKVAAALWTRIGEAHGIRLEVCAEEVEVRPDQVPTLALIAHELVANCHKHAFPAGHGGRIRVEFARKPEGLAELSVIDDGIGLSQSPMPERSFGMSLVSRLAAQLDGDFTVGNGPASGTRAVVRFPLKGTNGGARERPADQP